MNHGKHHVSDGVSSFQMYATPELKPVQSKTPDMMSDAELLAHMLQLRGESGHSKARRVLCEAGCLASAIGLDKSMPSADLTEQQASRLAAAVEMVRRAEAEAFQRGPALSRPGDAKAFLSARLKWLPYEVFAVVWLDNRHRVLAFEELFRGTVDGATVHPREVVREAIKHNAAATVFAHNHPSGRAFASAADRAITMRLRDALAVIDVRVLDHLIVGSSEVQSMADQGYM